MSVSITNDKAKKLSPSPITFHKVKRNTKYECANCNKKQMNLRELKIHVMGTAETSCFAKIKEPKQTKCKSSEVRPKIKYLIYNKSSMKLVCGLCFNAARKNNDTPPISHTVLGVMGFYQHLIGNGKKRPTCPQLPDWKENRKFNLDIDKANNAKKKEVKNLKDDTSEKITITKEEYDDLKYFNKKWNDYHRGCISCIDFTKSNDIAFVKCCKCCNYVCQTHLKHFGMDIFEKKRSCATNVLKTKRINKNYPSIIGITIVVVTIIWILYVKQN